MCSINEGCYCIYYMLDVHISCTGQGEGEGSPTKDGNLRLLHIAIWSEDLILAYMGMAHLEGGQRNIQRREEGDER